MQLNNQNPTGTRGATGALDPTVRLDRSPAFWAWVAGAGEGEAGRLGLSAGEVGALAGREGVVPLASAHGGYLFARLDAFGAGFELHALYRREGWGREAHRAGVAALRRLFGAGALYVTAFEMAGNRRSRPPASFGFRALGPVTGPLGDAVLWILTREAWLASPAHQRLERHSCPQP